MSRYYIPSRTAIGLRVKDGVVLAVEKLVHSKLLVPAANRRVQIIDRHIGLVRSHMYHSDPHSQPPRLAPDSWLMDDTSPTERETRPRTIVTIIASRHLLQSVALVLSAHYSRLTVLHDAGVGGPSKPLRTGIYPLLICTAVRLQYYPWGYRQRWSIDICNRTQRCLLRACGMPC